MHKIAIAAAISFFGIILWAIYLANTGTPSIFFRYVLSVPNGDKWGHFILFGFLTLLANGAFKLRTLGWKRFRVFYGTILVSVFVVLEEVSQLFIPTRTFDGDDLLADCAGILLFTIISALVKWGIERRKQAHLP